MTVDQFRQKLDKPEKFNDLFNYLLCIFLIGFGLWLIFDLIVNGFSHSETGIQKNLILLFPLTFIIIGLYGFWRISRDYRIGFIYSLEPIDVKWKIVNEYVSQLKIISKKNDINHLELIYVNKFLNRLVVNLYLDDDKILFNVRSGRSSRSNGFIDLGLSKRAHKKLKNYLEGRLIQ